MSPVQAFAKGLRAVAPLLVGVTPFGVIFGVVALQSGIPAPAAIAMSAIVFAGSAQLILAQLVAAGAAAPLIVATIGLVNLRHALYSASVAPILAPLPRRWKWLLAYFLTDEAYGAAIPHLLVEPRPACAHWLLLGAGFGLWFCWQISTVAGVLLGAGLPGDLGLEIALPLTLIAIVVPMIDERSKLLTALVAGAVAIALVALPHRLGLIVASLAGVAAGVLFSGGRK